MDWKNKDYLKITIIGALVIFALSTVAFVYAYSRTMQPAATFTATGEGKVVAVPDTATFSVGVLTEGKGDLVKLQQENTDKSNAVIQYLKSQGVEDKDIKTENYYLNPQYAYPVCRTGMACTTAPSITGYSINNVISVKLRDFNKASVILSGAVAKGANIVNGITLTVDDKTALENQAREEAMKQATDKAKTIAKAGGFRLGRLLSVDEYTPGEVTPMYGMGGGDIAVTPKAEIPAPVVQPGSQEIIIDVTLRYAIG